MAVMIHVGHCVSDLARSRRFYEGVFGFAFRDELTVPDAVASKLLRVPEPVGLTAQYLVLGDQVLELLHFDRSSGTPAAARALTDRGLTHLSFTVEDLAAAKDLVERFGGEVLVDTDVGGAAVFVRDPDGQLLELLPPDTAFG